MARKLVFRRFIPSKRHKYGIKLYKLCFPHGITYRLKVYTGKEKEPVPASNLVSENVVTELCESVLNEDRTLCTDNFYTSVSLEDKLLLQKTHLVGTLHQKRTSNPKAVVKTNIKEGKVQAYNVTHFFSRAFNSFLISR